MNISLTRISVIGCILVLGLASADRASASSCPVDTSSPTAEFSVHTGSIFGGGTPVCGTLEELPIVATIAGGGEHYMECVSKIERPGEILQETYAIGNGYGSNNHILHNATMHLGDVVISGGPGPTVDGALNFFYGGDEISCAASNCYTGGSFWTRVNGGGYYTFDYVWGIYESGSVPLAGLPVGTPFNLNVQIQQTNSALAFTTGSQSWSGFVQFLPSRVFDLPAGYTVNSVEGNIVDNRWCRNFIAPDIDGDCDVDENDLLLFTSCASGPTAPLAAGCKNRDFDDDNDADLFDFSVLQCCFSGADQLSDPDCAN